jgi:hypothetical protein
VFKDKEKLYLYRKDDILICEILSSHSNAEDSNADINVSEENNVFIFIPVDL